MKAQHGKTELPHWRVKDSLLILRKIHVEVKDEVLRHAH